MQRLRSGFALPPWIFGFGFFAILGRVSGNRSDVLDSASLLQWMFWLGVFIPTVVHLALLIKAPPAEFDSRELDGARLGLYAISLVGVFSLGALLAFGDGPDPAYFADWLLIYLGKPWLLVLTLGCLVACCTLLPLSLPMWLDNWGALNPKQSRKVRWVGGGIGLLFGLVALGVVSYYATGWAWWVESTL